MRQTQRVGALSGGQFKRVSELVGTVAALVAAAALLVASWNRLSRTNVAWQVSAEQEVPIAGAPRLGSEGASLVLMEFASFDCDFCAEHAHEVLPLLRGRYVESGKMLYVARQFRLTDIVGAEPTADGVAVCANQQGGYWTLHDDLFGLRGSSGGTLTPLKVAANGGLDAAALGRCLAGDGAEILQADRALGLRLGITGTPTFFLGTRTGGGTVRVSRRLTGAAPIEVFADGIEAMLGEERSDLQ